MHWRFDENGEPFLDNTIYDTMEVVDNNNEVLSRIKYLGPDQASKYLGHYK